MVTARFAERGKPRWMVSMDPVTLQVVHDGYWGGTLSTWLYELHYRLLLGRNGAVLMGVLSLSVMAMIVAGAVQWWRSGRSMKARLAFDPNGNAQRKVYDIHRILGAVSAVFLFITIGAAVAMTLPVVTKPLLAAVSPTVPMPRPKSAKVERGQPRLTVDRAVAIAQARLPEAEVRWIKVPNKPADPFTVRLWQRGEPSHRFPRTYVFVDQFSGEILAVRDGLADTPNDTIRSWFYPLHSGEAFGLYGRCVVAFLGLTPTILLVTGIVRWRAKARTGAARRKRAAATTTRLQAGT